MAKNPSPQGKPQLLQTMLFAVAAYMIFNRFMAPQQSGYTLTGTNPPVTVTTSDEALRYLKIIDADEPKSAPKANANYAEATQLLSAYTKLLKDDVDKKRLDPKAADDLNVQAAILTGHIQLKDGLVANESAKIRMAYNALEHFERKQTTDPVWAATPIEVTENGAKTTVTGHTLYESIVATLSKRNQTDYIWGFIPGGYQFIDALVGLTGRNPAFSYAFATLLLAFVVRAAVFPLSQKQLMTSRQMSQLAPRLKEIKEKFGDEPTEMNRRSMELYSRYGINPFSGCLPALVQMPLFLTVYQCMVHYQFEFRNGTFLWINPAASKATHGILAANLGQLDYPLIAIYGVTMIISTLLTPVNDPTQAKQQRMIGLSAAVIFPIMMCFGLFPVVSGFVLYWTFTNLFSMAQSLRAYRMPLPPLVEVNAPGGGVFPGGGKPKGRWAQMMDEMQKMQEQQPKGGVPSNGSANGKPKTAPSGEPNASNGKVSPARPVEPPKTEAEKKAERGASNAKHKPKKRN